MARMDDISRRTLLAGALAAAPAAALAADLPRQVENHAGYAPWTQVVFPETVPLETPVEMMDGSRRSLKVWLGEHPAVLSLWATWCAPCLVEKPAQSFLSRRLVAARSPTRLKMLQAYDDMPLAAAEARIEQLGGRGLDVARATPELEAKLLSLFGPSVNDSRRTAVPSALLLNAEGVEIGRSKGTMVGRTGQTYWGDVTTFQFLSGLDRMLQGPS
jgi:thiol-disulfide isomerase/thioredoxin